MRLIIEARLVDGDNDMFEHAEGVLAVVDRPDCCLAELGLTLAEGRSLLAKVQTELIPSYPTVPLRLCKMIQAHVRFLHRRQYDDVRSGFD